MKKIEFVEFVEGKKEQELDGPQMVELNNRAEPFHRKKCFGDEA